MLLLIMMTAARQQKEKDPIAAVDFAWLTQEASRLERIRELILAADTEDEESINGIYAMTDAEILSELGRTFRPI